MRPSTSTAPLFDQSAVSKWAHYQQVWAAWREPVAGMLIVLGLCGPFFLPSLLPISWWMALPLAVLGGVLRQGPYPQARARLLPLWAICFTVLLYALYAAALDPLSAYGREKVTLFAFGAGLAYLSARRQAPLTPELLRGMRWGLLATLAISLLLVFNMRELYLHQQEYGFEELKYAVSLTALPLIIALGVCALLPDRMAPWLVLLSGAGLLAGAVLEVMVRGRFHAVLLCVLAVVLVVGPPWKHIFWRVMFSSILLVLALGVYVNVLPLLGDSYAYLTWMRTENLAGRGPVWDIALSGFWSHPLGQGIGSFASVTYVFNYPHNVILEAAFEMGVLGLLSMLAVYLTMFRRVAQLWLSPPHRLFAAITAVVFLHALKSGDIATLAFQWVFLYLLVVVTPLSRTWPLVRGREVA